ncbi:MAG: hypothetical protein ACKVY0_16630 [Prosthecobacter sp.]
MPSIPFLICQQHYVSKLSGQTIRFRVKTKDADMYAIRFAD